MLGFGSISEFAISDVPSVGGIQQAIFAASGAAALSGVARSTAAAALAASGTGALAGATNAIRATVLAAHGAGALSGRGASKATSAFAIHGAGNLNGIPVVIVAQRRPGNALLTTSLIVDMNSHGQIGGSQDKAARSPTKDRRGRTIKWDA